MIGRTLGHFLVEARLGEGGMGVVYVAVDERLRRRVALKVLPDSFASDPDRRARFLREARASAAVSHANIATVHEIGEAEGHVFIAMELVEGRTLRERITEGLSYAEALRIAKDVCRGLAKAHGNGVVHRDLKPENVMIAPDGGVKILDFGLAKIVGPPGDSSAPTTDSTAALTARGRPLGTPPYMSPEQALGKPDIGPRTDVFSFGVMLYELLAERRPFRGDTSFGILYAVLHAEPDPLTQIAPGIPEPVAAVVERCLRKAADERFPSARELLAALELATPETGSALPARESTRAAPVEAATGMGTALTATQPATPGVASRPALEPKERRRLGRWAFLALGAAAVGAALASGWVLRHGRAVTILDQPLPPTDNAEARFEYAAGLQLLRDNAWGLAEVRFAHAAALDPNMALAHLRVAMTSAYRMPEKARAELATATSGRSQLSVRDRALMNALEPVLGGVHKDLSLAGRRLEELAAQYPRDVEILDWEALLDFARPDMARNAARRATALDPLDGQAWQALGRWALLAGDLDNARAAFERGSSVATDSIDNLVELGLLDVGSGRCDEAERVFQRATDLDPAKGLRPLASIRAALGRPEDAVRELLGQYVKALPAAAQPFERAMADVDMAVATGEFDKALSALEGSAELIADNTEYAVHEAHMTAKVRCLLEMGDTIGAQEATRKFSVRSEAWTRLGSLGGDGDLDRFPWLSRLAGAAGDFESTRAKWIDDKITAGAPPSLIWALGWAAPATTPSEARAAIAALEEDRRLAVLRLSQSGLYGFGMVDAYVGHTYLLAGRPDDALAYLEHATHACTGLTEPFDQMHAQRDLGVALEQRGDVAGACVAYRRIIAKWGHAEPRSETAETAKDAIKRLSCPD